MRKIRILEVIAGVLMLILAAILGGWHYFSGSYGQIEYIENDSKVITDSEKSEIDSQLMEEASATDTEDSPSEEIKTAEEQILENIENNAVEMIRSDEVFNILLIGTDNRENIAGDRSDSMIVLSINEQTKEFTMTSFMRDSYVQIPGYGNNRLNAAYAYGGADLLIDTIETNFKLEIDRFAKVGFDSFMEIIDAVGGIDMDVSDAEMKVMNDYIRELNYLNNENSEKDVMTTSGHVHLNGKQALSFSRIRYVGNSDFDRTLRQRNVLNAVFEKMKDADILTLNSLLNIILPKVKTNITQNECFSLLLKIADYKSYMVNSNRVPYDGTWGNLTVNGMMVLSVDFAKNTEYLQRDIYHVGQ